tara:strand:- start:695 stop:973 length:279 start_codon:yes stop_codon:yes gene_type:complete
MSDTITAWHDMQEENNYKKDLNLHEQKYVKYIFLLDFTDGKVYRYDISSLCTDENKWNPDTESCEAFLYGAGHKVNNCEWMVTSNKNIEYGN